MKTLALECRISFGSNDCRDDEFRETKLTEEDIPFIQDELDNATTIMYLLIESAYSDPTHLEPARTALRKFKSFLLYFSANIIKLNWTHLWLIPWLRSLQNFVGMRQTSYLRHG